MTSPLLALLVLPLSTGAFSGSGAIRARSAQPVGTQALTAGGPIWSYNAGYGVAFVSLGDRGSQVLEGDGQTGLQLFSSFDSSPPVPVWQSSRAGGGIAARDTNVYLAFETLVTLPQTSQTILHKFTSSSAVPDWSFRFAAQLFSIVYFGISRDGRVIVSSFNDEATGQTELRVHDPSTGVPSAMFVLPAPMGVGKVDVSPDGSVAALTGAIASIWYTLVIDLATQSVVFSTPGMLSWKQGISDQGRVLVVRERRPGDGWHARVFVRQGGSYQEVIDRRSPLDTAPEEMAVSDDGSTVAGAWFYDATPGRFIVRAFDVASATMTMERSLPVPSLDNFPSDIAISADGSRFVVGSYGDGAGLAAELAVYSPTQSQPLVEYPAGGTVFGVDISPDGDRFVVSRAPTHAEAGYNHTNVQMYELGGEDLVVRGRPSIGSTIDFELYAPPGTAAFLLSSPRLASDPIVLPGIGTLVLGRSFLETAPIGVVPPSGVATFSLAIANDPALVGRTSYYQGLTLGPRTLTRDWVQLTILP